MAKEKPIPRGQQGFRPSAYEDLWLKMTPKERRWHFLFDMGVVAVVILGMLVCVALGVMNWDDFRSVMLAIGIILFFLFAGNRDPIE